MPVPAPNGEGCNSLNDVLTSELTAINQYFLHAKTPNWGYNRGAHIRAESIDEMKHAEQLIDRILYLGGVQTNVSQGHD